MPPPTFRQIELRLAKLEGHVAQAQAGALVALDAVSRLGTAQDVDMPRVFEEARERLQWKQGGLQLKPSKLPGANVALPTLGEAEPTGERCVVRGSHRHCKDAAGTVFRESETQVKHGRVPRTAPAASRGEHVYLAGAPSNVNRAGEWVVEEMGPRGGWKKWPEFNEPRSFKVAYMSVLDLARETPGFKGSRYRIARVK